MVLDIFRPSTDLALGSLGYKEMRQGRTYITC